jgi:glycosyltransferase involved in cell wall biosynthesis
MRWSAPRHWPKIKVVRCGIDDTFLAGDAPPAPVAPTLCFVGRLGAQKGVPLLIEAAARLAQQGVAFHLTLCGDGELRGEIEAAITAARLGDRVTLTGYCDAATVRRHILAARAFVLPSFAEGLPVVLMEALALERPVITTAIAGVPELVDAGCGWLIPAGTVDALVAAMAEALAAAPETLARMGAEGRARVLAAHDARCNGSRLTAYLRELDGAA